MRKYAIFIALVSLVSTLFIGAAMARTNEKVTICHAAGREGTTKFVEVTASYNAIYGQAGHFYEDGTPRAGHEDDYEGPCLTDTTTTTTSTPTSTTLIETTTSTEDSTTTTAPETTTSSSTSTTTTAPTDTSTTTTTQLGTSSTEAQTTTTEACEGEVDEDGECELPFTGAGDLLPFALVGAGALGLGLLAVRATRMAQE